MKNFQAARTNMVDSQIETMGVIDPRIIEAFETIPREIFVPENMRKVAYMGEDLALGEGRYLLEPGVHARMVQALEPKAEDVVLDIGGTNGYSPAIFSTLVTTVIALEEKQKYLDKANEIWRELDVCNVVAFKGALTKGSPENAPFDIIFLNGAVSKIPENLTAQLSEGGRLIAVVKEPGQQMGRALLIKGNGRGEYSSYPLFEVGCEYLPGFEPKPEFEFEF